MSARDPQIPIVELLPAFEEQTGLDTRPRAVSRAALDAHTPLGAELRALAARLRALGRDKRLRRIGVVGAVPGEGCTTVALGLARALAAPGQRVLLLELDFEHPTLDRELRLEPPETGVVRFLEGRGEVPLLRHPAPWLWLLSAGAARRPPSGASVAQRLPRLLGAADRVFDYVIGDCPPLSNNPSGGFCPQDHMDASLLVVSSRRQPLETLRRATRQLPLDQVLGMVLNRYEA